MATIADIHKVDCMYLVGIISYSTSWNGL